MPARPLDHLPLTVEALESRRLLTALLQYSVTDLNPAGATQSFVGGINDKGQVAVGTSTGNAYLWTNGSFAPLPALGGTLTPEDVNNSGAVVGYSTVNGVDHAFLSANGMTSDLGTLGGAKSYAYAINDSGTVVGASAFDSGGSLHAFVYTGGQMTDLGTLGGGYSTATGINAAGQILGISDTAAGDLHAFVYSNGQMSDLGTLSNGTVRKAYHGIQDDGDIAGDGAATGTGNFKAIIWVNNQPSSVGRPDLASDVLISDTNNDGILVGTS
ncbi:MAG: hypothetical protein ACTHM6_08170, partial [Tepidisphaeraceae bacterium]